MGEESLSKEVFPHILEITEAMLTGGEQIYSAGPRQVWAWRHPGGAGTGGAAGLKSGGEDMSLWELDPYPPLYPSSQALILQLDQIGETDPDLLLTQKLCGRGWDSTVLKTRVLVWNFHSIQMCQVHPPPRWVIGRWFYGEAEGLRENPPQSNWEAQWKGWAPPPLHPFSLKQNLLVDEIHHWNFHTEPPIRALPQM